MRSKNIRWSKLYRFIRLAKKSTKEPPAENKLNTTNLLQERDTESKTTQANRSTDTYICTPNKKRKERILEADPRKKHLRRKYTEIYFSQKICIQRQKGLNYTPRAHQNCQILKKLKKLDLLL